MLVQLTPQQRDVLVQLIDEALDELGPEIHHTMTRTYKDDLKEQRRELHALRDLLGGQPARPGREPEPATAPSDRRGVA
jgi:hypothetical protein